MPFTFTHNAAEHTCTITKGKLSITDETESFVYRHRNGALEPFYEGDESAEAMLCDQIVEAMMAERVAP